MKSSKLVPWNWFMRDALNPDAGRRMGGHAAMVSAAPLYMELDRLFDNFFSGYMPHTRMQAAKPLADAAVRPDLDISGDDKRYIVSVELPGVPEQDLNVELENNMLRISGEKRYEHESASGQESDAEQGRNFYRIERSYGSFQRVLELPDDVDTDAITAAHKDGVLTITLPRKAAVLQSAKRIAVNRS